MPRDTKQQQHREHLLKAYLKVQKSHLRCSRRHNTHRQYPIYSASYAGGHARTLSPSPLQSSVQVDSDSSLSKTSSSETSDDDSLGSEGPWTSEDLDGELFATELDAVLEDMPELLPAGYPDSDDEESGEESDNQSEPDSDSSPEINSGHDADDEAMLDDDGIGLGPRLACYVRQSIDEMYSQRYEEPHDIPVPHPLPQMPYVLEVLKLEQPNHFREILRVNPTTFDKIVNKIKDDPVFFNQSTNSCQRAACHCIIPVWSQWEWSEPRRSCKMGRCR